MERLKVITYALDTFFDIKALAQDPAFSRFIPMVYEPIGFDWQSYFEVDFTARFNGLMLKGAEEVHSVYCSVFPTVEVLQKFIDSSKEGDFLFLHHPLDMECGDPRGAWGRGFQPIPIELLAAMKAKRLSFYACHVPLDYNEQISTGLAIARALHSRVTDRFLRHEDQYVGLISEINPASTQMLIEQLKAVFDIPYVDFEGVEHSTVHKLAIVPGSGDRVAYMQEAEAKGVQAYIAGEIHAHIDNDYGRQRFQQMMAYVAETNLALIGVSHAASEYLVMKEMKAWFEQNFAVKAALIPLSKWWR